MACVALPPITITPIQSPFSITPPALPPVNLGAEVCCKNVAFSTPPIPIPLPPGTLSVAGLNAAIATATSAVDAFLDQFRIACPKEL